MLFHFQFSFLLLFFLVLQPFANGREEPVENKNAGNFKPSAGAFVNVMDRDYLTFIATVSTYVYLQFTISIFIFRR